MTRPFDLNGFSVYLFLSLPGKIVDFSRGEGEQVKSLAGKRKNMLPRMIAGSLGRDNGFSGHHHHYPENVHLNLRRGKKIRAKAIEHLKGQ